MTKLLNENTAVKIYDIHKDEKDYTNILNESMPEYLDSAKKEKLISDETFVLVGYSRNNSNIEWYKKEGKYNFRMDDDKESLSLETNVANVKYLLLREPRKDIANKIFKLKSKGPKVIQGKLLPDGYITKKLKDYYLVIDIGKEEIMDFNGESFNVKELENYKTIKSKNNHMAAAGIPFAVTVTELMKTKVKNEST